MSRASRESGFSARGRVFDEHVNAVIFAKVALESIFHKIVTIEKTFNKQKEIIA